MRLQCERAEGEGATAEADSKSSLICVRAQNSARREHFPKKESPVRLYPQDDAISIFKIAELCYKGGNYSPGNSDAGRSSAKSSRAVAVAVHGCSVEFH